MSRDYTYACTVLHTTDAAGEPVTYRAGDVVRPTSDPHAFADCVVLGFSKPDKYGDVYAKLARPYAYASCVGTTCTSVLTGVEEYTVSATELARRTVVSEHPRVSAGVGTSRPTYEGETVDHTLRKVS